MWIMMLYERYPGRCMQLRQFRFDKIELKYATKSLKDKV